MFKIWDSDLKIIENLVVIVPIELLSVLEFIQSKVNDLEFSILCKGKFNEDGYTVFSEFYVPEQEVTSVSVEYTEDLHLKRKEGYEVIIHSHPFSKGSSDFSGTDEEFINSHFTCSLLYVPIKGLVKGSLKIKLEGKDIMLKLPVPSESIVINKLVIPVSPEDIKKIKIKELNEKGQNNLYGKRWRDIYGCFDL
jgi:hypothetical protein